MSKNDLWAAYTDLKGSRMYDAAKQLNVSEGELLASAPNTIFLGEDIQDILLALATVGPVLSITRNENCVSEKKSRYHHLKIGPRMGLAINVGGIDVRIFTERWYCAVAFETLNAQGKLSQSIQFFDHFGVALQKIYKTDETDAEAWDELLADFWTEGSPEFKKEDASDTKKKTALSPDQIAAFRASWLALQDIHHFNALVNEYDLNTHQALAYAPEGYSYRLSNDIVSAIYLQAKDVKIPLITFVGNRGVIQIQTGPIHHVKYAQGWFNIFDAKEENFTMHLNEEGIVSAWLVTRPTRDGHISCIMAFDKNERIVLSVFGKRQEGQKELAAWREVLTQTTGKILAKDKTE